MKLRKITIVGALLLALAACNTSPVQPGPDGQMVQSRATGRDNAKIHTELGAAYFGAGNAVVALQELSIALAYDPGYYPAKVVRGLVYTSLKEFGKAEADFQSALSAAPKDPGLNNNYGWYLCETGRVKESIPMFLTAIRDPLYPTPEIAYTNAGACALKMGDLAAAETYLLVALNQARDGAPLTRTQLAKLYFKRGALEQAKTYLSDAVRLMEPPSAEALWLGVRIERKLGNRVVEGSYAAQLRSRYPTSPEYQDFLNGRFDD